MNLDDYVKTVGDYADQVAAADANANRDTMAVAAAMDEMFQSGAWVAEWLEQRPEPKRPTNRWDPADRNRFVAWTNWKLEQAGRRHPERMQSWRLLEAEHMRKICSQGSNLAGPPTERAYRPLYWLRKNRYENRAPEVWALAVELAGGNPRNVTSAHTREALAEWRRKTFTRKDGSPKSTRQITAAAKAHRLRRDAFDEVKEMYRLACIDERAKDEYLGFLGDLDTFIDEHQSAA